jgi:hypothetical protein
MGFRDGSDQPACHQETNQLRGDQRELNELPAGGGER